MEQFSIMGNIKKSAPGPGAYDIKPVKNNVAFSIRARTNIFGEFYHNFLRLLLNFYFFQKPIISKSLDLEPMIMCPALQRMANFSYRNIRIQKPP